MKGAPHVEHADTNVGRPGLERRPDAKNAWHDARELTWRHRYRLLLALVLMLIGRLSALALPVSSKVLIDDVIGGRRSELLIPLALAVAGATLLEAACSFALTQLLGVAAHRAIADMRKSLQAHVSRLPVRFFDSTQTGVLISRIMTDPEGIRHLIGSGLTQLAGSLLTAVLALGVLIYLNWKMTAVTLLLLGVFGVAMAVAFRRVRPLFRLNGRLNAEVTGRLAESLGGIRIVKAYRAERREARLFARGIHRMLRNTARWLTASYAILTMRGVIGGSLGVVMIIFGGQAMLGGGMTLGDFVMYIFLVGLLANPVAQMAATGTQISEALASLDRIREIKQLATEEEEDDARAPLAPVDGEVAFEDVSFEYEPGIPVLRHVSYHAPAGTTTALVGASGSGKSTLISLVMAFNRPTAGRVLVDGHDLAGVRLGDYREQLGIVLQDNVVFDGTIAENIRFSLPHATMEQVQAVSRVAHCDEFIESFPKKYDTIVGERGVRLSGGQRQRVAIARAILADPTILILDEATSSLDSDSEALIQDGLRTLRRGRTTFVIAHRLSTIQSADQILVLEAGEIVERGTHTALMAQNGPYRRFYQKQYRIESDRFINRGEEFSVAPERVSAPTVTPPTSLVSTG